MDYVGGTRVELRTPQARSHRSTSVEAKLVVSRRSRFFGGHDFPCHEWGLQNRPLSIAPVLRFYA